MKAKTSTPELEANALSTAARLPEVAEAVTQQLLDSVQSFEWGGAGCLSAGGWPGGRSGRLRHHAHAVQDRSDSDRRLMVLAALLVDVEDEPLQVRQLF